MLLLAAVACGKKGDPLPPLRHVPARVDQIAIAQRGAFLRLDWEAPRKTDHGSPKVELRQAEVFRRVVEPPPPAPVELEEEETRELPPDFVGPPPPPRASAPPSPPPRPPSFAEQAVVIATLNVLRDGGPVSFHDPWDASWAGKRVEYAVRHRDHRGRPSQLSTIVGIEPVAPLSAPTGLEAAAADGFVEVTWMEEPMGDFGFDVFRRPDPGLYPPAPLNSAPLGVARYEDATAPWGVSLCYQVKKVAVPARPEKAPEAEPGAESRAAESSPGELTRSPAVIESPESAEVCLTPLDTFAPPTPEPPVALAAAGGVLISWKEVRVPDLAGYLVYRAESEEGPFEALTPKPIEVAAYTDRSVEADRAYFYTVSAVDRTVPPNESARSQAVSARAGPR